MSKDTRDVLVMIITIIVIFSVGMAMGSIITVQNMRRLAIESKAGYYVMNSKDGTTNFKFGVNPEENEKVEKE